MGKPPTRKMKPEIRAIVDWASSYGWTLRPSKDGGGHWVLDHPTKGSVRLPDTPSEARGIANAKANIRRLSGLQSDSGPAARYRHEPRQERFSMDETMKERALRRAHQEAEALRRARARIDLEEAYAELSKVSPRKDPDRARELAARIVELREQLNSP